MVLKITSESSSKRGRITDDRNSYIMTNFISIVSTPTSSTSNHIKYIDLPKTTEIDYLIKSMLKNRVI